jgi:uncharacterized damage-inducible protein DinB
MAETAQQYIKRIQGHIEGKDPLKVQKNTAKSIEKVISRLSKKQLRRRPGKGKWSIAEILAHLADAELVIGWRLRMILSSNGAPIQAFDQDSWATTFRYEDRDPKQSLKMFRLLRSNNLDMLDTVPRKLWNNHGMHAERGKETVSHLVRLYAGHDLNHLKQIEQIAKQARG